MIRASELYGRVLVDLDTAEKVGNIDEIIVDPYAPGVAGYVVSVSHSLLGRAQRMLVASESVHAIGPDAVTVRHLGSPGDLSAHLDALPRLSELTGRKMVSHGGRLLGTIEDALIDERDSRIIGYPLDGSTVAAGLERLFALGLKSGRLEYVRADADLRVGARLVVVPDDAVAVVDEDMAPALPDASIGPAEVVADDGARVEPTRRPSLGRRSALAVSTAAAPEPETIDAALVPPSPQELAMDEDLGDTTPLTVPARARRRPISDTG
jgi:uncharacterized protein YrrD